GPLLLDDPRDGVRGEGLDVRGVGELGVGHDRGRVRVHEDDAVALTEQRLARLRARVVELARLADHDRPGPDHEDRLDVGSLRHQAAISSRNRSNRYLASCGPGAASGWYCTLKAGTSRH